MTNRKKKRREAKLGFLQWYVQDSILLADFCEGPSCISVSYGFIFPSGLKCILQNVLHFKRAKESFPAIYGIDGTERSGRWEINGRERLTVFDLWPSDEDLWSALVNKRWFLWFFRCKSKRQVPKTDRMKDSQRRLRNVQKNLLLTPLD